MDLNWLENHLLPCPFKSLTGMDCPGCGVQRSVVALLQGNISQSFHFYPALIPVLITFLFLFLHLKFHFKKGAKIILTLFIFSASVIMTSYIYKEAQIISHSQKG